MSPNRRTEIERICQAALDQDPTSRAAFVVEACTGDEALRQEVESLLAQETEAERFMEAAVRGAGAEGIGPGALVGRSLGPYRVVASLGAGGMGEVYRAHDTKLGRDVALKVLPHSCAREPEWLARFQREAKVLASLSHPNIAAIYGFEELSQVPALVLELVEGPTLSDCIAQGPIPLAEALRIATQIVDALENAHEHGVIHRDLKPANIKLRPDGTVKVLDFGLAKAVEPQGVMPANVSRLRRITVTETGMILGTAAYMSPEQARGQLVDKRTDIWAFGCVMFELLAGRRAFEEDTVADTLAAIVGGAEPKWSALPSATPDSVRRVLRRCLAKDRGRRLADVADVRLDLEETQTQPTSFGRVTTSRPRLWHLVATAIAGILAGALMIELWRPYRSGPSEPPTSASLLSAVIDLPSGANVPLAQGRVIALSPDGRQLAYVGQSISAGTMVYLHDLQESTFASVPGTEGASSVFFSPDGRWLGFLTADKVKKVALDGGSPIVLCNANSPRRASWAHDDAIYFDQNPGAAGYVSRVPASGGEPVVIIPASGEGRRTFSQMLPDGRTALMSVSTRSVSADYADVVLVSGTTGQSTVLIRSAYDAQYVSSGHVIFARASNVFAVPFDASRFEVTGEPVLVVSGASSRSASGFEDIQVALSATGLLAYIPGDDQAVGRLSWVDRRGTNEFLPLPAAPYKVLDLSPNDQRLAVHVADVTDYILVHDLVRGESRRLAGAESRGWPVWGSDSTRLAFAAWRSLAAPSVRMRDVDRGDETELLPASTGSVRPSSWSPAWPVLTLDLPRLGLGMALLTIGGAYEQILDERFQADGASFSPEGRWVAYTSTETGRGEVFVRPSANFTSNRSRQISTEGGREPVWCPCGELFYRNGNRWMSVRIRTNPELNWDAPTLAFETDFVDTPGRSYDVSANGMRLLIVKRETRGIVDRVNLVVNWVESLRRSRRQ